MARFDHGRDVTGEDVVHVAEPGRIDVEDADAGAETDRGLTGARAGDPRTEDHDLPRADAGDAGEQHAATAGGRLQAPGPDLDREPAGDLAHRREQRQAAVVELNRLVPDRADAVREQRAGQNLVGGEMQIGEEDQTGPEIWILGGERLFHLEDHLGLAPHLGGARERRARRDVRLVGETAAAPGAVLDHHHVPVRP